MDKLQQLKKLMREEVDQLKKQVGWIVETLQDLLVGGEKVTLVATSRMVTPPVIGSSHRNQSKSEPLKPKKRNSIDTSKLESIPMTYT